ncbi:MAG: transcriptional repressor [Acidobacteriota bacterium]|jgi:Fur family ferric uptake transcriptional regulator
MGSRSSGDKGRTPAHAAHREALRDYLGRRTLKWTRQREAILDIFLRTRGHLTAEEVYGRVSEREPRIGFSTVYRTLRLFVEAGVASERHFHDGVTRYEVRQPHHDHLVCVNCGKILEFERADIERLQEEVARTHGFRLLSHRHELYGTCADCLSSATP